MEMSFMVLFWAVEKHLKVFWNFRTVSLSYQIMAHLPIHEVSSLWAEFIPVGGWLAREFQPPQRVQHPINTQ